MAKKKPSKKAAAAKKKPTKRTTAKKAARKPAAKSARKAAGKTARKAAPKKAAAKKAAAKKSTARKATGKPASKAAPRKAAAKKTVRKAPGTQARRAAPSAAPEASEPQVSSPSDQTVGQAIRSLRASSYASSGAEPVRPLVELVETTSAGTQPLAPEHAAVDELTSSGNELLDIFQKYDRNRTGYLEAPGFARLLEALGQNISDEELMIAFDIIDTERTGKISWKQFKNWWTSR
ncbi:MAG TPA: EF-hand domain-containing protein [Myxococcaceae bacterium]|jgi:hypothetical protein